MCAAKFSDGEWYRARVEKMAGNQVSSPNEKFHVSLLLIRINYIIRFTCCTSTMVIEKLPQD